MDNMLKKNSFVLQTLCLLFSQDISSINGSNKKWMFDLFLDGAWLR